MKNIYITTIASLFASSLLGQVGIGTVSPNTNSILDLTNGNNKVLVVPKTNAPASSSIGNVYFNTTDNTLNYHDGTAYNSLSAWKFKYGTGTIGVHTTEKVGIGGATPQTTLHIKGNGGILELEGTTHSYMSFYPDGHSNGRKAFLGFQNGGTNDVTLKNETTTGNVVIDFTNSSGKLDVKGKVQENGSDLVPKGIISMWYGSVASIPTGWTLCNGSNNTPDLRERFVVGAGGNNTTNATGTLNTSGYNVNDAGGKDTVKLSTAQMPSHTHSINHGHTINDPGHSHSIPLKEDAGEHFADDAGGDSAPGTNTNSAYTGITVNNHTGNSGSKGSGTAHENRPPYYALAFIMKL